MDDYIALAQRRHVYPGVATRTCYAKPKPISTVPWRNDVGASAHDHVYPGVATRTCCATPARRLDAVAGVIVVTRDV